MWDLVAGGDEKMSVRAPFSSTLRPRKVCNGSLVAYVSVLEPHFKPCRPLRRWRICDVQTAQ